MSEKMAENRFMHIFHLLGVRSIRRWGFAEKTKSMLKQSSVRIFKVASLLHSARSNNVRRRKRGKVCGRLSRLRA